MIIAIDGPAGSGKTTVARLLAEKLEIFYLDTGATYRALTYAALNNNLDLSDKAALEKLAEKLDIKMHGNKVYLNGEDITAEIREPIIDKSISLVVSFSEVRDIMVELQRNIAIKGNFVVEGRDITTVVFPKAEYKFYLDANHKVRAHRRFKELGNKGLAVSFEEVEKDLARRDLADKSRVFGPLRISDEAECIDTTDLTIAETVEVISKNIKFND